MANIHQWIETAATAIEVLAVSLMVAVIFIGTLKWIFFSGKKIWTTYQGYRLMLVKAILLGLELLVAADIIRTVALSSTLINIATLAALVLVRTFLGWSLTVEVEGRWPWQKAKQEVRWPERVHNDEKEFGNYG